MDTKGEVIAKSLSTLDGEDDWLNTPRFLELPIPDVESLDYHKYCFDENDKTHANSGTVELISGDVVVGVSDGVSNNLYDKEIIAMVDPSKSPQENATNIKNKALERSQSEDAKTPYGDKRNRLGGKIDDISVFVAIVE